MTASAWRQFVGQNIKGNPAMSRDKVAADVRVVKRRADVAAIQEFKWRWYFLAFAAVLKGRDWASYPGTWTGDATAQPVWWKRKLWKKVETRKVLLHKGEPGISEIRYLRGVLLRDRASGLECWFVSGHFVVGGDAPGDSPKRKAILRGDVAATTAFLSELVATDYPVIMEVDANIHGADWLPARIRGHAVEYHGKMGVEYLVTIDNVRAVVQVKKDWTIPTGELFTDHEGRGITFRLKDPLDAD